ncbi:MAG: YbdD/YjiX family protein [Tetrasphaera sp.]|nr:YbdD/YjiX family protein [Tetrasphaera sp.]
MTLLDMSRSLRWFWSGVTGADAYDRYCAHLQRVHPGCPLPTKSDFWREKYAEMERNPKSRCC